MASAIPRFLLPQMSSIWTIRTVPISRTLRSVRHASNKAPSKPRVLEKPTRFNPPSHGAKLRKDPPSYPGPQLSSQERVAQQTKRYPNMMPPEGSFSHWFLNNRSIHLYITLTTLFSLAGFTFIHNFKRTSKFGDMLPNASDLLFHPIAFTRTCVEVLRLHTAHVSAETAERRRRKVEDVQKRAEYRKAHGLETEALGGWTAKSDKEEMGPAMPLHDDGGSHGRPATIPNASDGGLEVNRQQKRPLKKWLGIW